MKPASVSRARRAGLTLDRAACRVELFGPLANDAYLNDPEDVSRQQAPAEPYRLDPGLPLPPELSLTP